MREELEDALIRDFPLIFNKHLPDVKWSARPIYGFECGDGWEPLIRELAHRLSIMIFDLPDKDAYKCSQVKEKFGGLRFYMEASTEEMDRAIRAAESESYETCETCGKSGTTRSDLCWIRTLCDTHAEEQSKKERERSAKSQGA